VREDAITSNPGLAPQSQLLDWHKCGVMFALGVSPAQTSLKKEEKKKILLFYYLHTFI